MMNKVVVRFRDGRLLKGTLVNFRQGNDTVNVADARTGMVHVFRLNECKALFFVRDFHGEPTHRELKDFEHNLGYGRKTVVRFEDDEELWGYTQGFDKNRPGFFLFPVDPNSNNQRIYVVHAATKEVRFVLRPGATNNEGTATEAVTRQAIAR
ncbi:MAG: hypothetical protein HUU55_04410 [Myxococcales bacterium]|nr:hypothetical protein [Myxococcales bacterium]